MLVNELNGILRGESIYDDKDKTRFEGITLTAEASERLDWQLAQAGEAGMSTALNRYLLESAFPPPSATTT